MTTLCAAEPWIKQVYNVAQGYYCSAASSQQDVAIKVLGGSWWLMVAQGAGSGFHVMLFGVLMDPPKLQYFTVLNPTCDHFWQA